mgnify:FL=1
METLKSYKLFHGISLSYVKSGDAPCRCCHTAQNTILEINYCKSGRIGWKMSDGSSIYLGPGDFSVHTRALCENSLMTFPNGNYCGICIVADIVKFDSAPPEYIKEAGITLKSVCEVYCGGGKFTTFTGNEGTKSIFSGFYNVPENLNAAYLKLKLTELILYLEKERGRKFKEPNRYKSDQVEIIKQIHDRLTGDLSMRITIEELSRQYLMNASTIKQLFKAVYGNSIAAHIKEHRMERAAQLLLTTADSISAVAASVGYESQSKFTQEFKKQYQMLPKEYRKIHTQKNAVLKET